MVAARNLISPASGCQSHPTPCGINAGMVVAEGHGVRLAELAQITRMGSGTE